MLRNLIARIVSPRVCWLEAVQEELMSRNTKFLMAQQELAERREEIDDLETELAATKAALSAEGQQADYYAELLHETDQVANFLYEQLSTIVKPAEIGMPANFKAAMGGVLLRLTNKGGDKGPLKPA